MIVPVVGPPPSTPFTNQRTWVFTAPVTLALKATAAPSPTRSGRGLMATRMVAGRATRFTSACCRTAGSAARRASRVIGLPPGGTRAGAW